MFRYNKWLERGYSRVSGPRVDTGHHLSVKAGREPRPGLSWWTGAGACGSPPRHLTNAPRPPAAEGLMPPTAPALFFSLRGTPKAFTNKHKQRLLGQHRLKPAALSHAFLCASY